MMRARVPSAGLAALVALLLGACSGDGDPTATPVQDADADGVPASLDCDDRDPETFPGADERCDGLDGDCDSAVDEGVLSTFYLDSDGDGVGGAAVGACAAVPPLVETGGDCDDGDPDSYPGAEERCDDGAGADEDCDGTVDEGADTVWYTDADHDGWGDEESSVTSCAPPPGTAAQGGDCDDADPSSHPGAQEVCAPEGLPPADEDCDGLLDAADPDAGGTSIIYLDADGDTWGDPLTAATSCGVPEGDVTHAGDCDDGAAHIYLGAAEGCDGVDDDCDGLIDDADPSLTGAPTWYVDGDGDGAGAASLVACEAPEDAVATGGDCDDADAGRSPLLPERCDVAATAPATDEDCDGAADEAGAIDAPRWYADADGDTVGDAARSRAACEPPAGYVLDDGDCDDGDPTAFAGAPEREGTLADEDCDGAVDEAPGAQDADGDGFDPAGGDCDEADPLVSPGAPELWGDGVDNDCDGHVDADRYVSQDGSSPQPERPLHSSIHDALAAAADGELVAVAAGSWTGGLRFAGRDVLVVAMEGPLQTDIDAQGSGPAAAFVDGEGPGAGLRGFLLTGGDGEGCPAAVPAGGGVCIVSASPTVALNLIEGNEATLGGGVYVGRGAPNLRSNRIRANGASVDGGGVYLDQAAARILGDEISGNVAGGQGGGIYMIGGAPVLRELVVEENQARVGGGVAVGDGAPILTRGRILGNIAVTDGGGLAQEAGGGVILGTVLAWNGAQGAGGAVWIGGGAPELSHVTLAGNVAAAGGGVALEGAQGVVLTDSILAFNAATGTGGSLFLAPEAATPTLEWDLLYLESGASGLNGVPLGPTLIVADPRFLDDPTDGTTVDDDYRLNEASPARDGGDPSPGLTDPDGSRGDLGAWGGPWALTEALSQ